MDKLIEIIPEAIKEAAQSNLGIFALLVIVIAVVAILFFREAPVSVRVGVFVSLFLGAVLFGIAMFQVVPNPVAVSGTTTEPGSVAVSETTTEPGSVAVSEPATEPEPELAPEAIVPVRLLGSCIGRGDLEGVHFWGPEGADCNGIPDWGKYLTDSTRPAPTRICSCIGHGGPEGVRLWGPEGEACGGIRDWGLYDKSCVTAVNLEVCGCFGHGDLKGHTLWGPKDMPCGGMTSSEWGYHSLKCVLTLTS